MLAASVGSPSCSLHLNQIVFSYLLKLIKSCPTWAFHLGFPVEKTVRVRNIYSDLSLKKFQRICTQSHWLLSESTRFQTASGYLRSEYIFAKHFLHDYIPSREAATDSPPHSLRPSREPARGGAPADVTQPLRTVAQPLLASARAAATFPRDRGSSPRRPHARTHGGRPPAKMCKWSGSLDLGRLLWSKVFFLIPASLIGYL